MGCRLLHAKLPTPDLPLLLQDHIEALKTKLLAADARLNELESSNHDLQSRNQVMDSWLHLFQHMGALTKASSGSYGQLHPPTAHCSSVSSLRRFEWSTGLTSMDAGLA